MGQTNRSDSPESNAWASHISFDTNHHWHDKVSHCLTALHYGCKTRIVDFILILFCYVVIKSSFWFFSGFNRLKSTTLYDFIVWKLWILYPLLQTHISLYYHYSQRYVIIRWPKVIYIRHSGHPVFLSLGFNKLLLVINKVLKKLSGTINSTRCGLYNDGIIILYEYVLAETFCKRKKNLKNDHSQVSDFAGKHWIWTHFFDIFFKYSYIQHANFLSWAF